MTVDTIDSNASEAVFHCKNHPDRETLLRCNKCGEPICTQCAVLTDVGEAFSEATGVQMMNEPVVRAAMRRMWAMRAESERPG